jgi:hypothetical protein
LEEEETALILKGVHFLCGAGFHGDRLIGGGLVVVLLLVLLLLF